MSPEWGEPPLEINLASNEVHVWHTNFSEVNDFGSSVKCLSTDERTRADRFKNEHSKRTFVGSRIFLRHVLGSYLRISPSLVSLEIDHHGKPRLTDTAKSLNFNLSHADCIAICAVCAGFRVGIDLEKALPDKFGYDTATLVFSESEQQSLQAVEASEQQAAFLRGWTRKEAYAKCVGLGMSLDLRTVQVGLSEGWVRFGDTALFTFLNPNHCVATLAATHPGRPNILFFLAQWHAGQLWPFPF
jgi:4'-phosphopantetheinyl transferase